MDSTKSIQICKLLVESISFLKEEVERLHQESERQEPLIRRLLGTEIEKRNALISQLQEAVEELKPLSPPPPRVRGPITVIMPDGERIEEKKAVDTLEKTIVKIGIEDAKLAQVIAVERSELYLISEYRDPRPDYQKRLYPYWLFTKSSTDKKLEQLETINLRLRLGMKIIDNRSRNR